MLNNQFEAPTESDTSRVKAARIKQLRGLAEKATRNRVRAEIGGAFCLMAAIAGHGTPWGWAAFVLGAYLGIYILQCSTAASSFELEANLLEGPRLD